MTITHDDTVIGQIPNAKELKKGQSFPLSDGRLLLVQLKQQAINPVLEVLLEGQPVPGSGTHPQEQVKAAEAVLWFIAGFNILLGLMTELLHLEFLSALGLGWGAVLIGTVYLLLGYWVKKKQSLGALYVAVGFLVLYMVLTVVYASETGANPVSGLILKIIFLTRLFSGIKALKHIRKEELVLQNQVS
jgi:hypothetical protein